MKTFCAWAGLICLVAAIVLSFETNLLTGLTMVPGAMVLLVLAKHLDNQDEIIEAVRTSACPQLYYFSVFAPKLIEKVIAEESPDLADSEILISKPKLASDGAFRIRGSVSRKKGIILHSVDFFADFAPEEYYHRPVDWSLKRFEWI